MSFDLGHHLLGQLPTHGVHLTMFEMWQFGFVDGQIGFDACCRFVGAHEAMNDARRVSWLGDQEEQMCRFAIAHQKARHVLGESMCSRATVSAREKDADHFHHHPTIPTTWSRCTQSEQYGVFVNQKLRARRKAALHGDSRCSIESGIRRWGVFGKCME